ncbi:MAG: hypothetical protein KTR31_19345 [Myxococcales bacterium]|nr:hypothetical protein [Myxococcales bacterium]
MIAWMMLACSGNPSPMDTGEPVVPTAEPTFQSRAEEAGFTVQEGAVSFMDEVDCCEPGANCIFNNPSTPYGSYTLPPAPDQRIVNPAAFPTHDLYYQRADEAVVFLGTAPPQARYFSFRSYVWTRPGDALPVFGSLGPTVNNLSVAQASGGAAADQPLAIVSTFDADVEASVVALLLASGWDPAHIHRDRMPAGEASLGLSPGVDEGSDVYAMIIRVAVPTDPVALEIWRGSPGQVFRLSPTEVRTTTSLHAADPLPQAGSGMGEQDRVEDLNTLEAAIREAYPDHDDIQRESTERVSFTYDCFDKISCLGESADAYYADVPAFLMPNENFFMVVYGVDHQASGHASYASFAVEQLDNRFGVLSVDSTAYPGTAAAWGVKADGLYAWTLARDCDDPLHAGKPCSEIATGCPGVRPLGQMAVRFRAYLDPSTGTEPLGAELVRDRAMLFVPEVGKPKPKP